MSTLSSKCSEALVLVVCLVPPFMENEVELSIHSSVEVSVGFSAEQHNTYPRH